MQIGITLSAVFHNCIMVIMLSAVFHNCIMVGLVMQFVIMLSDIMQSAVFENCIMMSVNVQNVECSGKVTLISCTNLTLSETNTFNLSFTNNYILLFNIIVIESLTSLFHLLAFFWLPSF